MKEPAQFSPGSENPDASKLKRDQQHRTDHLNKDLARRSVRGGVVTFLAKGMSFPLALVSTLVLARLLTPRDFGLIALVSPITGFLGIFLEMGLSQATIQKVEVTDRQVSTLFWVNTVAGLLLTGVVTLLAPVLAWFYRDPRVLGITLTLGSLFLINGLAVQHRALLQRQMKFPVLAGIRIFAQLAGVATAIAMAWFGFNYWALVLNLVAARVVEMLLLWAFSRWIPGWPSYTEGVGSMLRFGGYLTGFNIANYISRNLDNLLIGKMWGPLQLGFYSKAYSLLLLPVQQINVPIAAVAVPGLSRLQEHPDRFRRYYLHFLSVVAMAITPISVYLVITAPELIPLVLGSQWVGAVPIFRLLSISAIFQPFMSTACWLYVATGRTRRLFYWGIFFSMAATVSFLLGLPYGAQGVALSYSLMVILLIVPCIMAAALNTPIRLSDFLSVISKPIAGALLAGAVGAYARFVMPAETPALVSMSVILVLMLLVYVPFVFYFCDAKKIYRILWRELRPQGQPSSPTSR